MLNYPSFRSVADRVRSVLRAPENGPAAGCEHELAALARVAASESNPERIIRSALEAVRRSLAVDCVCLLQRDRDQHSFRLKDAVGWPGDLVGSVRIYDEEKSQELYTLGCDHPVMAEDVWHDPRFRGARIASAHGLRAGATVRIGSAAEPFGVLAVHHHSPRAFSEEDAALLYGVASLLSHVISRFDGNAAKASDAGEEHRRTRGLGALTDAARGLFGASTYTELQEVLRSATERVVDFDAFVFALHDETDGTLSFLRILDRGIEVEACRMPVAGTPAEQVIRSRRPLVTSRADESSGATVIGTGKRAESIVRAPVIAGGRVLGLLSIQSYTPDRYSEADVEIVEALAALSATAISKIEHLQRLRAANAALERSEAHYRRLISTLPYTVYAVDGEGRFTELNAAAATLLQRTPEDLLGEPFAPLIDPEDLPRTNAAFEDVISGARNNVEEEVRVVRPSGERRRIVFSATAIREEGGIVGLHGIARDVTERRAREHRMRMLTGVLDSLGQCVSVTDPASGTVLYSNAAWTTQLGVRDEADRRFDAGCLLASDDAAAQLEEIRSALDATGQWSGRVVRRHLDGEGALPFDLMVSEIREAGSPGLIFTVLQDASQMAQAEKIMRRAEHLASLETLVGGVAHELSSPLSAVINLTELLIEDGAGQDGAEDLRTVLRESQRMARLVSDLRSLGRDGRREPARRERVDLNDVIRHVIRAQRPRFDQSGITITERLDATLPAVEGDRDRIEQVMVNLVVNAEQAISSAGSKGHLIVSTCRTQGGVSVQVVDDGPGMEDAEIGRIFDPFFTTRGASGGTGLGLGLVHRIVNEHRGMIYVDSTPGHGTAFRVELPAPLDAEALHSAPSQPNGSPRQPVRILVVDDEPSVRRVIARFLTRRGHSVEEAADGSEALRRVRGSEFDVVLSDLRMPELGGTMLHRQLSAMGSAPRLVLMTGDAGGLQEGLLDEGVQVLLKPLDLAQVELAVTQAN